jgi:hypothetical protein
VLAEPLLQESLVLWPIILGHLVAFELKEFMVSQPAHLTDEAHKVTVEFRLHASNSVEYSIFGLVNVVKGRAAIQKVLSLLVVLEHRSPKLKRALAQVHQVVLRYVLDHLRLP